MRKTGHGAVPDPGEGKRGEAGHLGYLLRQASGAFRARVDRALSDLGVTAPQFAVMTMIRAYDGLSGADLARLTLLTPQTVSVIVANLKRAGALASAPHPVHGRVLQLTLTPQGMAVHARCRARVDRLEAELAHGLSERDEAVVRRWLVRAASEPGPSMPRAVPRPPSPRRR
ncbi:MAG: MarR family transcriptional regulator [Hyphomicrobiaceae bacterium]|nr:MarR family transcriptional regulator [Hyphomicrobiaceae bacterium]